MSHDLAFAADEVVKAYRSTGHDQPRREGRTLEPLAEHAPGLLDARRLMASCWFLRTPLRPRAERLLRLLTAG